MWIRRKYVFAWVLRCMFNDGCGVSGENERGAAGLYICAAVEIYRGAGGSGFGGAVVVRAVGCVVPTHPTGGCV